MDELRTKVSKFNPDDDYIVISGSPIVTAAVFMLLAEKTREVKMLRWSNRDRVYQPLVINTRAK